MKANCKILTLIAALAVGTANAEFTKAGTTINNTATASYTNPVNSLTTTVDSNQVSTTVKPKPLFDIEYFDGSPDGTTAVGALPSDYKGTILPGGTLITAYKAVNTGNTDYDGSGSGADQSPALALAVDTTDSPNTGQVTKYYLDANNNGVLDGTEGNTEITTLNVPWDDPDTPADEGQVSFIQVITVPANAAAGDQYASSPNATGELFNAATKAVETKNETDGNLGLQFSRATIITPDIGNTPKDPGTGTVNIPPAGSNPVPGYTDPANPDTPVAVNVGGDVQTAYPKADTNNNPDKVTFNNTITNGNTLQDDPVNLFPVKADGVTPWDNYNPTTGVFTDPSQPGVEIRILDTSGNPIPAGPDGYPQLTVPKNNGTVDGTADYRTEVTYPDSNSVVDPTPYSVQIAADSGLDAGITPEDLTTNTILPPAAQFGDDPNADPAPEIEKTGNPGDTVEFEMVLKNNGEYADAFNLTGTVQFTLEDGSTVNVPVKYFDGATEVSTTGNMAANTEKKLTAKVEIPANAAATMGSVAKPTLDQTATSVYSGLTMTDTNDKINVNPVGEVAVAKFTFDGSTAGGATPENGIDNPADHTSGTTEVLPEENIIYKIIGKNNFNTPVKNFFLQDAPPANTEFVSVLGESSVSGATIIYSTNGTTWSNTAPTGAAITNIYVAIDDGVAAGLQPGELPANATMTMTMTVKVK